MKTRLTTGNLRKVCEPGSIILNKAPDVYAGKVVGQERAEKALKFGIGIRAAGFNIYVAGIPGSGRLLAAKRVVEEAAAREPTPADWCYIHNFKDPYQPKKISMPAGKAVGLKKDMKLLIQDALQTLIKTFESDEYANRRKKIVAAFEEKQSAAISSINERAGQESFMIKQTPWEIITIPLIDGEPVTDEQFIELPDWEKEEIRKRQDKFLDEIKEKLAGLKKQEREVSKELDKLEREVAAIAIGTLLEDAAEPYSQLPEVLEYFKEIKNDILENLPEFLLANKNVTGAGGQQAGTFLKRYEVNVLVDNSGLKGAPVVIERNPTYNNLLGRVEKESFMGTLLTDFTMIRKGSMHSANGGYLIIRVEELLRNYFTWDGMKRALRNKEIVIEDASEQLGWLSTRTLKPEPIPVNIKVVLIGHPAIYYLLYTYEPEFKALFKVKADFDTEMNRSEMSISDYAFFAEALSKKEGLLSPDAGAVAKLVEHGSRLVSDQQKLSTHFDEIGDILREANHYAAGDLMPAISAKHVLKAIEEKVYRSNLIQEKLSEWVESNQIFIDIKGKKTGQVNGLSVLDLGDISFGRPNRISCTISLGKEGIIGIEREAELSGPIHTKGVLILTGYLSEKYIQQKPVSLTARLVFEQSYSEVEGDSASSAELYTILSNLANLPIRQGIAVTGSVNQKGEVQAIGGVNEKIEGFFELCKRLGFTGDQGVIIPAANMRNLMLKEAVLEAVGNGQFSIWAVDSIDDGIEILTGVRAGTAEEEQTVAWRVSKALNEYADRMQEYSRAIVSEKLM